MKEILKLQPYFMGKESQSVEILEIKDYADTSSVSCISEETGEELKPYGFMDNSNPYFKLGDVLEKYQDKNIIVEYDCKELEMPKEIFDTADGLNAYIDSLQKLWEIINIRSIAHQKKDMTLHDFVLFDLIYFGHYGQVAGIGEKIYCNKSHEDILRCSIVTLQEYRTYVKSFSATFEAGIPDPDEVCPQCGKKWTLDNIDDYICIYDESLKRPIGIHKMCSGYYKYEKELDFFKGIFAKIYELDKIKFKAIPNEYAKGKTPAPWFIVKTPDGSIKIGWREKVVIAIEWLDDYRKFTDKFTDQDVTKGFGRYGDERYIHAWGKDLAVQYLNRAKLSLTSSKVIELKDLPATLQKSINGKINAFKGGKNLSLFKGCTLDQIYYMLRDQCLKSYEKNHNEADEWILYNPCATIYSKNRLKSMFGR